MSLSDTLRLTETKYEPEERTIHGLRVKDLIYNIIDHNSVIAIWSDDPQDTHYSNRLWKGMAHSIPEEISNLRFKRVFSSVPDTILEGDVINIDTYWK